MSGNRTLRGFREWLGLTQRAFAKKAKINHVHLCQVERGAAVLGGSVALRIVDAFSSELAEQQITLEDLLRDSRPAA